MSLRNFFSGRVHLQDSIFLRYSFSATENAVITLEDLKCPQVESDAQPMCGRIDFTGFEPEQFLKQWDDIVCASQNSEEVLQMLFDSCDSVSSVSNNNDKLISFTLLPSGCALQQLPYGLENRTVCGIETLQAVKVELDAQAGTLTFIRERYVEDLLESAIGSGGDNVVVEDGKSSPHVQRCAIITLNQNRGMKRLDTFMRLATQTRNFMFPSFDRLYSLKNNYFQ
jgi:hypothetical protein